MRARIPKALRRRYTPDVSAALGSYEEALPDTNPYEGVDPDPGSACVRRGSVLSVDPPMSLSGADEDITMLDLCETGWYVLYNCRPEAGGGRVC